MSTKNILKKGEISLIINKDGGSLSEEVHLVKYQDKKYILRKCSTLKIARGYEKISLKLEKYGFLPKLIGKKGKNLIYEFIEGRHLKKNESMKTFKEIGKIVGRINTIQASKENSYFKKNLKNIFSGKFAPSAKTLSKRKRNKTRKMPKKLIGKKTYKLIQSKRRKLFKKTKARITWDSSDITTTNFIMRKGKIYLVDIESIKPSIKGYGISKFYYYWGNTAPRKKAFEKGYKSILPMKYFNKDYQELINLSFIIQKLNWFNHIGEDYTKDLERLNRLKLQ